MLDERFFNTLLMNLRSFDNVDGMEDLIEYVEFYIKTNQYSYIQVPTDYVLIGDTKDTPPNKITVNFNLPPNKNKIEMIIFVQKVAGYGLRESKEFVEQNDMLTLKDLDFQKAMYYITLAKVHNISGYIEY